MQKATRLQSVLLRLRFALVVICAVAMSLSAFESRAQSQPVSGNVHSSAGQPLIGATVVVKGTTQGTITDAEGRFTVNAASADVLEVSYLGYTTREVAVGVSTDLSIELLEDLTVIDNVVVTALGIERSEKALSYNVQTVGGEELTTAKSANFVNSLAGKVAGVQINPSGGPGGGVKVVSRGMKSLKGSNNVLYVIDGIPLNNSQENSKSEGDYETIIGSEGIADINPDDIESLSMLTGPAAAALYGNEGANGVILITTKKGTGDKTSISVSNNTSFSNPLVLPKFQNKFLSAPGSIESWGPEGNVTYNPADFFQMGFNTTTGVTVQSGKGKHQAYFSAANTTAEGILPNNTYDRYNFALRYTTSFLKDKMTLDASANYIIQSDKNMVSQGVYNNPLPAAYLYPRENSLADLQGYEFYNEVEERMDQRWAYSSILESQNPYWTMNRMNRENKKHRYMFTATLKYDITDYLNVTGRANIDNANVRSTRKYHAGTLGALSGPKGRYHLKTQSERQTYADLILNFNKTFGNWSIFVNAGGSIKDYREESVLNDGDIADDRFANVFTLGMLKDGATRLEDGWRHQTQSVFFNAEVGFKSMIYLTVTGRNDWDSSMAYGSSNYSFFYPSVGASFVFSQMFKMPRGFDFAKLRFAYTGVGSGIPGRYRSFPLGNPYLTSPDGVVWSETSTAPYINPLPEKTFNYEVGADLRFLGGALTLDVTWYLSNTYSQTFEPEVPTSDPIMIDGEPTRYGRRYIQAGNIQNTGVEVALGFNKIWGNGFGWRSSLTYSYNKNTVKELMEGYDERVPLAQFAGGAQQIRLAVGGSMSDLYVQEYSWKKDPNGQLTIKPDNTIEMILGDYKKVGSMYAHSFAGWSNSFSYKGIDLSIQIRGRFGGYVISQTQAYMDFHGVSQHSADLRGQTVRVENRGVLPKSYLQAISQGGGRGSNYVYDATNIRLGEVSLSYTMPRKWFKNVVGITVGFVATNVAMLYCKAPFDPEQTAGAGNTYYNGVDNFMVPSTRNLGFNVKLQF